MNTVLAFSPRSPALSTTRTSGPTFKSVPPQPELPSPQGALAPSGSSHLRAFLTGVIGGFLLASLSLALLLVDAEHPAPLALAALLDGGGGIGAVATLLVAPSQRPARWRAGGVLMGLGFSFLFACILPFYC